jgi:Uma2 family endonuclease
MTFALSAQAPEGVEVEHEMTLRLDERNRPEPDIVATTAAFDDDRTWYDPSDVLLAVDVVSPESEHRDRTVKPHKYAEAGIAHYWVIGQEEGHRTVVHVYELDAPTRTYVPTGIHRDVLRLQVPFVIDIDLGKLIHPKR